MPKPGNEYNKLHLPLLLFVLLLSPSFLSFNNDHNNAWVAFGIPSSPLSPPSSDAIALLAFKAKADPGNRLPFSGDHCRWAGVRCSAQGRVIRLVLEGYGLNGTFAERTLPRLDQLRILSLKANALAGPIPDLTGLANLKALFLDHNLFAGSFPASLLSLHRLRTLDLSHNNLSGHIPPALASLDRLYSLHLEWNLFNGSVPPLNQSSLKFLNVSSNDLSGAVPVTAALSALDASAFAGNPGLCGEAVRKECDSHFQFFHGGGGGGGRSVAPSPAAAAGMGGKHAGFLLPGSASPSQKMHKRAVVVIEFLAGAFLVIGAVGASLALKRKKKEKKRERMKQGKMLTPEKNASSIAVSDGLEMDVEGEAEEMERRANELAAVAAMSEEKAKKLGKSGCLVFCAGEAQVYTLEQLMRASAEMLGRGSVGTTYKAVLDNRLIVSVKRLDASKMGMTGKEAFERHMDAVGRLRHPNLVPLRAYFQAKEERLLVYDYQPNGSLYSLIHGTLPASPSYLLHTLLSLSLPFLYISTIGAARHLLMSVPIKSTQLVSKQD